MNKISKVCFIAMAGLLSIAVPSFAIANFVIDNEKQGHPVKAASGYDATNLVLSPLESVDIDDISEGGHYLIVAHNPANADPDDPEPVTGDEEPIYYDQSALWGCEETYYSTCFNVELNSDYSIDVDKYIYQITASMFSFAKYVDEFEVEEMSTTHTEYETYLAIINENSDHFMIVDDYWSEYVSSASFPDVSYEFEEGNLPNSWHLVWKNPESPKYAHLNYYDFGESSLSGEDGRQSEIFVYEVPEWFYQQYSWKYWLMNIQETDDAGDLLAFYQQLSPYARECFLSNFFEGDPDNESGTNYPEYSDFENYLYLETLLTKFQLYEQIVGATYSKPIACADVNEEDIVIDPNGYSFSGFSPLYRLYYSRDNGSSYHAFNINLSGFYFFFNSNSDEGNGEEFAGETIYFVYGSTSFKSSFSNNPLSITFPAYRDTVTVDTEGITENFAQIPASIEDGETKYIDRNFDYEFELAALPTGFEATLVTESFFNKFYNCITDTENYGDIDTSLVHYSTDTLFTQAYDDEGVAHDLEGGTTYYLLFRLPATADYLQTFICGYASITTATHEDCFVDLVRMDNYEEYQTTLEIGRFSGVVGTHQEELEYFIQSIDETLMSMESEDELDAYLEERSLSDRYYIECSKYMLIDNYQGSIGFPSSRKENVLESLMEEFNDIIGESGEIDREALDAFIDESYSSLYEEINLLEEQEYAAMEMADYLNELSRIYIMVDNMDGAFDILRQYSNQVYQTTSVDQIREIVNAYKSTLKQWFLERVS